MFESLYALSTLPFAYRLFLGRNKLHYCFLIIRPQMLNGQYSVIIQLQPQIRRYEPS